MTTDDLRIRESHEAPTPIAIKARFPGDSRMVAMARETISAILHGQDERLLVIVGPCSVHEEQGVVDYATRLQSLANDDIFIVMRAYFEKPRTRVGWKGMIRDPHLDDSSDIAEGIVRSRRLLAKLSGMGIPAATEFLDPLVPQYLGDLVSWAAIGARTTESQTHRELASGLSMPVGFKNRTDGDYNVAIDSIYAAQTPHSFLGISQNGQVSILRTTGNLDSHLVLRGGSVTNYDDQSISDVESKLRALDLAPAIVVDCSHGNSQKNPLRQIEAFREVLVARKKAPSIKGVMLESYLESGNQPMSSSPRYGVSVTDACLSWNDTERLLRGR